MFQQQKSAPSEPNRLPVHNVPPLTVKPPSTSPRLPSRVASPVLTSTPRRRVAIAVDLSDESAFAVKWAVQNYLRPGDAVVLLHVQPTSGLYGADWGISATSHNKELPSAEEDFDNLTSTKATHLAEPLVEANVPFKIHIVKDHDLKERLCLEVERLGLSAMIMGSRGFGASSRGRRLARLGSVSDYCVHYCICPVVVVRNPDGNGGGVVKRVSSEVDLHPVPEEEHEYHDADDELKDEPCFT